MCATNRRTSHLPQFPLTHLPAFEAQSSSSGTLLHRSVALLHAPESRMPDKEVHVPWLLRKDLKCSLVIPDGLPPPVTPLRDERMFAASCLHSKETVVEGRGQPTLEATLLADCSVSVGVDATCPRCQEPNVPSKNVRRQLSKLDSPQCSIHSVLQIIMILGSPFSGGPASSSHATLDVSNWAHQSGTNRTFPSTYPC